MDQSGYNNKAVFAVLAITLIIIFSIVFFLPGKSILKKINSAINSNSSQTSNSTPVQQSDQSNNNLGFNAKQAPTFNFNSVAYAKDIENNTTVYNSNGQKVEADLAVKQANNGTAVKIINSPQFTPGKYTIVIDENGKKIKQDFTWGVLAINPDKANYKPGENALLSLAVLDEKGKMVCNANVTLTIKDPTGNTTSLTTQGGDIIVNPDCNLKSYTEKPDYETNYKVAGSGTYEMNLTAITPNGTYSIIDFFTATNDSPFDVQRTSVTRIYPIEAYPVKITVTANEDFIGQIKESVPSSFKVSKLDNYLNFDNITQSGDFKYIIWNVSLKKGQIINIGYKYNAPIISPQFYLIGALAFYSDSNTMIYQENRFWQIASDAIGFVQEVRATGNTTSFTFSITDTAGDLLVLMASTQTGATGGIGNAGQTISDTEANTWVGLIEGAKGPSPTTSCTGGSTTPYISGSNSLGEMYYTYNIAGGSNNITVHQALATDMAVVVEEFSGIQTSSAPFDVMACGTNTSGANWTSGATATTANANEVAVGFGAGHTTPPTVSITASGWTQGTQQNGASASIRGGYDILSSTQTQTCSGTFSPNNVGSAGVATFIQAPSGGGGSPSSFQFQGLRLSGVRIN